ncbi:hypothetical protein [Psychrobacter jeotgali]|uniref:hypothetical protein n=1 Tax=Psychrobacter jeotgali TaxID=179010 RepID=UPI00191A0E23|nr:hypothetical protein [Psychrobacter jeotgali]
MAKRLISTIIISTAAMLALTGCDNTSDTAMATEQGTATGVGSESITNIDWNAVATEQTPVARADFDYPFAIDSQNVRDYADYFSIDNATAQHNLTVGMASNEPLSKVLEQLGTSYTSHELTDGEAMQLIIHTTPDIAASSYDYVFAEDFAKGLTLPIVIMPDGVKGEVDANPHEGM